jgi:hypothetical protein
VCRPLTVQPALDEHETRAAPKSTEPHSSPNRRRSSGAEVPGGSVTSAVLCSASRTLCDDPLPDVVVNGLVQWWSELISMGRLVGTANDNLSMPRRRLVVVDMKEQVCTAEASGALALP